MTYAYTKQEEEELRRRQALAHMKRMEEQRALSDFHRREPVINIIKDVTPKNQEIED